MEIIRLLLRLGRWIGGAWGVTQTSVSAYELATRPDRDVWVEMIGSVISLHSLYIAGGLVGAMITVPAAIAIFDLRPNKRAGQRFLSLAPAIEDIIRKSNSFSLDLGGEDSLLAADREVLRRNLEALNVHLPADTKEWGGILPHLLACARSGRIQDARKLYAKDDQS